MIRSGAQKNGHWVGGPPGRGRGVLNTTSVEVVGHAENADDVYDVVGEDFVDDLPD